MKSLTTIKSILFLAAALLSTYSFSNDWKEEAIKRFNSILEKNRINNLNGESYKNQYVFFLTEEAEKNYTLVNKSAEEYGSSLKNKLNNKLISFFDNYQIEFYIGINGLITGFDRENDDLMKFVDTQNSTVSGAFYDLLSKTDFSDSKESGKHLFLMLSPLYEIGPDKVASYTLRYFQSGSFFKSGTILPKVKELRSSLSEEPKDVIDLAASDFELYSEVLKNYEGIVDECQELFNSISNNPNSVGYTYTQKGNYFYDLVEKDPCLLKGVYTYGEGLGYETDFMKGLNKMMEGFLYVFAGTAGGAILLPAMLEGVAAEALIEKSTEFVVGSAVDGTIQLIIIYLDNDDITPLEAVKKINKYQMLRSGVEATIGSIYLEMSVSCLGDAVLNEDGSVKNVEEIFSNESAVQCVIGAISAYVGSKAADKLNDALKNLVKKIKANPEKFIGLLTKLNINDDTIIDYCRKFGLVEDVIRLSLFKVRNADKLAGLKNADELLTDLANDIDLLKAFNKNADLVDAWDGLKSTGLSKNIDALTEGDYLLKNGFSKSQLDELAKQVNEVFDGTKSTLSSRINSSSGFSLNHTDDELQAILLRAKSLDLPTREIDDLLYISGRDAKLISADDLMQQMDNWVNVVQKRGYPYKFSDASQFQGFSSSLKSGLNDVGVPVRDVRIQGSSLRTPDANDVDLVAMINQSEFDSFVKTKYNGTIAKDGVNIDISGMTNQELKNLANDIVANSSSYSRKALDDFAFTVNRQIINAKGSKNIIPGFKNLRDQMVNGYPNLNIENIAVQPVGSGFDLSPFMKL